MPTLRTKVDLQGPILKIRRAEREIERLKGLDVVFLQESHYRIVRSETNPKTGKDVYRVVEGLTPDPDWGVWIGEIAHNLRSALDGLVYQLALLTTNTPARQTQFPIYLLRTTERRGPRRPGTKGRPSKLPHFEGQQLRDGRPKIRNLRPEHQAFIERLQPYKRGRGGKNSPIFRLQEINNADKHRLIQVVAGKWGGGPVFVGWGDMDTSDAVFVGSHMLKDGAKFLEASRGMHVGAEIFATVAFADGCEAVKGLRVMNVLNDIRDQVSGIIDSFQSEFPSLIH